MDMSKWSNSSGVVLASTLVLMVSLILVAVTVAKINAMGELMASNQRDAANAMSIADSGIENGFAEVRNNYVWGQTIRNELFELTDGVLAQGSISAGGYSVTVVEDVPNDDIFIMNSVGNVNGSNREIEIVARMAHPGRAALAILTEASIISLDGNPTFTGPYADIHSNSDVDIAGDVEASGSVSASGQITSSGNPVIDGGTTVGAARIEIPHVYPPDYKEYATIILTADCKVELPDGTVLADASLDRWHGWDCIVDEKWTASGNAQDGLYSAFYYIHGNVEISGLPNDGIYWLASFVAEGYIQLTGNGFLKPWASTWPNDTGDAAANDILFLSGNDIVINGNPSAEFYGIMATHMEISIEGNPYLNGSIMAENGDSQEVVGPGTQVAQNLVDLNSFSGNMRMDASGSGIGSVKILMMAAWRELVH